MITSRHRGAAPAARHRSAAYGRAGGSAAKSRGYTLIEVIVAFALLAVGLGILLAILSGGVRQVAWAGQATHAALYADSLMSTLGADSRLQTSRRQGEFEHGRYRWTMQIVREQQPVPPPSAEESAGRNAPPLPDPGDVNFRANELYRIALDLRWGDAPDQRLHIDTLRAYAPGPDSLQ